MAPSPSPTGGILQLPLEIAENIAEWLIADDAEGSLVALAATCRQLYHHMIESLYKGIGVSHPALVFWAADYGRLDTARRIVAAGIDLNRAMRRNQAYNIFRGCANGLPAKDVYRKFYRASYNFISASATVPGYRPPPGWNPHPPPPGWVPPPPPPGWVGPPMPAALPLAMNPPPPPPANLRAQIDIRSTLSVTVGSPFSVGFERPIKPRGGFTTPYPNDPKNDRSWSWWRPAPAHPPRYYYPFWFPLHIAARNGDMEMAKLFLQNGARVNVPSQLACPCVRMEELWYAKGAHGRSRRPGVPCWTPLHTAICCQKTEMAKLLLENGASIHVEMTGPALATTALHDAARRGLVDLMRHILDQGFQEDIHVAGVKNIPPLWSAYLTKHWPAFDFLLSRGASVDHDFNAGYTPLVDACWVGEFDQAIKLVDRGANVAVTCRSHPYDTEIFRRGHVREILFPELQGVRPLDLCCLRDDCGSLRGRHAEFYERQKIDGRSKTSLYSFILLKNDMRLRLVRRLLSLGADVGPSPDPSSQTPPLVSASAEHMISIMSELILHGADVNATDKYGLSPLLAVIRRPHHWCGLANQPSNWDHQYRVPRNDKIFEQEHGRYCGTGTIMACLELLIENGSDIHHTTALGDTVLTLLYMPPVKVRRPRSNGVEYLSCSVQPWEAAQLTLFLVKRGANPDQIIRTKGRNIVRIAEHGNLSVLQTAFWLAENDVCRGLIRAGASLDEKTWHWMLQIMASKTKRNTPPHYFQPKEFGIDSIREAFRVLDAVDTKRQAALLCNPACLYLALLSETPDLASHIWRTRLSKEQFCQPGKPGLEWLLNHNGHKFSNAGALCIYQATRSRNLYILSALLGLGLDPNESSQLDGTTALFTAVDLQSKEMAYLLMKHGADMDVSIEGVSGHHPPRNVLMSSPELNPLRAAIQQDDMGLVDILLQNRQESIPANLQLIYLRDAYRQLSTASLNRLLQYPSLRVDAQDMGETVELPLIEFIRDVSDICGQTGQFSHVRPPKPGHTTSRRPPAPVRAPVAPNSESSYSTGSRGTERDSKDGGEISRKARFEQKKSRVSNWIDCLVVFAKAGADPMVKNRAGESALDCLGQLLNYDGKDWFKTFVSTMLRSRLSLVARVPDSTSHLDPMSCFNALTELELPEVWMTELEPGLADEWDDTYDDSSSSSSSSSGEIVD